MINKNYSISKIEKFLHDRIVGAGIMTSDLIFLGSRPTVDVDKSKDAYIVISIPSNVIDKNAYGSFIARIEIYVRDLTNGRKNINRLNAIHDQIFDLLPIKTNTYSFDLLSELGEYDTLSYHATFINLDGIAKA